MKIREVMTEDPRIVNPEQDIQQLARIMDDNDIGALLVSEGDRLVGVVTDRDIATRAVAKGKLDLKARDVMTKRVLYCFEDEDLQHVAEKMADVEVRRLPVLNREKRLVGIVSLANIAASHDRNATATALEGTARRH